MFSLNKVTLAGNLTRDIELKYTPSGMAVARMGLAVNRKWRDAKTNELREEVTFVDIDVFGKQAETAHQYLSKGKPLYVEGRLKLDSWDDKTTGQKVYKMKVVCEHFQFLNDGKGKPADGQPAQRPASAPQQTQKRGPAPQAQPGQDAAADIFDLDEQSIPF